MMLPVALVSAQEKSDAFKARFAATRSSTMNLHFTKSDTIDLAPYLNTRTPIYSLSVDATIVQPREGSFTRIVLEDSEGKDWLVLECDHFRYDRDTVCLRAFCQETAMLFGITPSRLKCYVAADANLTLNAIHATDQRPERGLQKDVSKQEKLHAAMRREQVQTVVDSINRYNEAHSKLWMAGVTKRALYKHHSCHYEKGTSDSYLANLKYYVDGIYDVGEAQCHNNQENMRSSFVSHFDWRNRHGKCWITNVKNQGGTAYCTAFSIVGMLEARTNLFFNQQINLNLSEQDIVYNYFLGGYYGGLSIEQVSNNGLDPEDALETVMQNGVLDSISVPFINGSFSNIPQRPNGIERISIANKSHMAVTSDVVDSIKKILIKNGPIVSGIYNCNRNHAMTLVGFHTIQAGDTVHQVKISSEGGAIQSCRRYK